MTFRRGTSSGRLHGGNDMTSSGMQLTVRLDPSRTLRWHVRLAERLAARPDTRLRVEWAPAGDTPDPGLSRLFALEKLVYRLPGPRLADRAEPADVAAFAATGSEAGGSADLVIDLATADPHVTGPVWRITFDGSPDKAVAVQALTQLRVPIVAVVEAASGREIVAGRPGIENKRVLILAFEDLLARVATLICAALDQAAARSVARLAGSTIPDGVTTARFAAKSLANAVVMRLYRLGFQSPHWRIGWRFVDGPDVIDLGRLPDGWHDLPDDRTRFYADPFPVIRDGRTYLFMEDFAHRLGRGVISVVEFDDRGPVGTPRSVLDTGSHLSYPFVFEHRGEMWMVPETCATGTIDLYRATAFPDGWVKQATLVTGVVAGDATLFEHAGKWWMLATVRDGGSYSDALYAWSAPDPLGPWLPHARNPILVDIASARPAGYVARRGGKLIRPVQDCTDGYGAALSLAEITRLDDDHFEQCVFATLRSGPAWPGRRLHTLNRAGRLECIDGSRSVPKF
jgi:hypothetical protein